MKEKNRIIVDLQSLLDIRQSALMEVMGKERALEFVTKEPYFHRDNDNFDVDPQLYAKAIADWTVALKNSSVTYIHVVINSKIANTERLNVFKAQDRETELLLNIYPYELPEHVTDAIRGGLFTKLTTPVEINIIRASPKELSPNFLKHSNAIELFCYDSSAWLDAHSEALSKGDRCECRVNFPAIGKRALEHSEIKEISKIGFSDIYQYIEFIFSSAIRINFLPIGFYCNTYIGMALMEKSASVKLPEVELPPEMEIPDVNIG